MFLEDSKNLQHPLFSDHQFLLEGNSILDNFSTIAPFNFASVEAKCPNIATIKEYVDMRKAYNNVREFMGLDKSTIRKRLDYFVKLILGLIKLTIAFIAVCILGATIAAIVVMIACFIALIIVVIMIVAAIAMLAAIIGLWDPEDYKSRKNKDKHISAINDAREKLLKKLIDVKNHNTNMNIVSKLDECITKLKNIKLK